MNKLVLVFACLVLAIPCQARIITVDNGGPADFNNIQAAINNANDGDTVLVAQGTYTENVNIYNKNITLTSTDPNDPNNVARTIIDGSHASDPNYGSVITIADADVSIEGFTITGGLAASGGGIYCTDSNLVISKCSITGNRTICGEDGFGGPGGDGGSGGGLYCAYSSLKVSDCYIASNVTGDVGFSDYSGGQGGNGGGMYCTSSLVDIRGCQVTGNTTGSGRWVGNGGAGAGFYCTCLCVIKIENCIISNNITGYGGVYNGGDGGSGGGLYCASSSLTVYDCHIAGNATGDGGSDVVGSDGGYGGGMYCASSLVNISGCQVIGNITGSGGYALNWLAGDGGAGGGIYCTPSCMITIEDCVISNNITGYGVGYGGCIAGEGGYGAGLYCSSATIKDSIFAGNQTGDGGSGDNAGRGGSGGGIYCFSGSLTILNSSLVGNSTGSGGLWSNCLGGYGGSGAGTYCTSSAVLNMSGCTVKSNRTGDGGSGSSGYGGGPGGYGGSGAGIFCYEGTIVACVITDNTTGDGGYGNIVADGGNGGDGAGIYCSATTIENCIVANNTTGSGGDGETCCIEPSNGGNGGSGSGIYGPSAIVTNCTIAKNVTGAGGKGGAGCNGHTGGQDGTVGRGAGVCYSAAISNSIVCDNFPDQLSWLNCANITYCDVCDGTCGGMNGNICDDPLFADPTNGDYHLKSRFGRWDPNKTDWVLDNVTSPCIDAGDPNSDWSEEPWPNGKRINMGAYGGTNQASKSGSPGDLNIDNIVNFIDYALFANNWYSGNSYTIPRGKVVVDGDISEWSENVEWMALDKVYYGSPNDVGEARFALKWDESTNKIYVAVVVEDFNHVFRDDYGTWDASDRLELYSQGDAAGGSYTFLQDIAQQYIIAPDTNNGSWATLGFGEPNIAGTDLEYAVKVKGDLIIYEAGVKQFDNYGGKSGGETIVTNLHVGHVVRFDVVADTRWSDTGFGMLSENNMASKFRIADNIAKYTLVEQSERPPCLELKADLDRNCIVNFKDLALFCDDWLLSQSP